MYTGKTFKAALQFDLHFIVDILRYYAGWADKIQGKTIEVCISVWPEVRSPDFSRLSRQPRPSLPIRDMSPLVSSEQLRHVSDFHLPLQLLVTYFIAGNFPRMVDICDIFLDINFTT